MPTKPIVIVAGGTGGHVYPALAVAHYLRGNGVPMHWLGTERGLEARIAPQHGFVLHTIAVDGLRGKGPAAWIAAPFRLLRALWQSIAMLRRCRPGAVLGMGGYVSGPGGLAAWLLRVPLLIHEQNAVAGLTNRLLAPLARVVMQGFPDTFSAARRAATTGNPVRETIAALADAPERAVHEPLRLLVLGGSQGARALNDCVPQAMLRLPAEARISVWHQCGAQHEQAARAAYRPIAGREVRVDPFIDDMAAAYAWADLVLCRAGALTVAELCAAGVASILVPFPHAVDDHQTANARRLCESGGAWLMPEAQLDAGRLAALLADLLRDRERLAAAARSARRLARPSATRQVGDACLEVLHA
jgi:UDP-N-acetylglucosamine--N-acetylmuramyl-(pentapeptide) pyrophosphoryl-undecaprenol N-acetylglucosamine transferase